jgi:hypothetical protein
MSLSRMSISICMGFATCQHCWACDHCSDFLGCLQVAACAAVPPTRMTTASTSAAASHTWAKDIPNHKGKDLSSLALAWNLCQALNHPGVIGDLQVAASATDHLDELLRRDLIFGTMMRRPFRWRRQKNIVLCQ